MIAPPNISPKKQILGSSLLPQGHLLLRLLLIVLLLDSPSFSLADQDPSAVRITEQLDKLNKSVWKNEQLAQKYEVGFIVPLWDSLRASKDPFSILAAVPFQSMTLGKLLSSDSKELKITTHNYGETGKVLTLEKWSALVLSYRKKGYLIKHTDWHHAKFHTDDSGQAHSVVSFRIDITRKGREDRVTIEGLIKIDWDDKSKTPKPKHIDASNIKIHVRNAAAVFYDPLLIKSEDLRPQIDYKAVFSPILLHDLNDDGLPEIIAAGMSMILWNKNGNTYDPTPMTDKKLVPMRSGVIGDFTGDGIPDLVGARIMDGTIILLKGIKEKGFSSTMQIVAEGKIAITDVVCLTSGDIDKDGDLDLWIGQWKNPYTHGMPQRYFDANDGFPAYLLVNQGNGTFIEHTEKSGLAKKRFRRSYSASFLDLDEDGDLDLLTVNDFAGIDIYHNDGKGKFTDVTLESVDESHNFGMSHTIADYNKDGKIDFYVQGMSSTTARRLDRMKAERSELPEHNKMRSIMGYGNRMYLGLGKGKYKQPPFRDQVARTGWSWGASSLDVDNDGDVDLFVSNGHRSGKSTKDYCTNFWCHDIYLPKDNPNDVFSVQKFIHKRISNSLSKISWDGFQPNRFLLNDNGKNFHEAGHLLKVGQNHDSRSALSADFDGDGWQDLLVHWIELSEGGNLVDRIMIFQNSLGKSLNHNWIGVHLLNGLGSAGNHGAKVKITTETDTRVGMVVSGDSYRCQHPSTRHFGLGSVSKVKFLEVQWSDGQKVRIEKPQINHYHPISHPLSRK